MQFMHCTAVRCGVLSLKMFNWKGNVLLQLCHVAHYSSYDLPTLLYKGNYPVAEGRWVEWRQQIRNLHIASLHQCTTTIHHSTDMRGVMDAYNHCHCRRQGYFSIVNTGNTQETGWLWNLIFCCELLYFLSFHNSVKATDMCKPQQWIRSAW